MTLPLALTVVRCVLAIAAAGILLLDTLIPLHVAVAAVCFIVAAVTDFFDGRIARARNQTSPLGAFLDPLADKLLVYLLFIYLTVVGVYPAWLLLLLFTRDIVTDSLRAFVVGQGQSMPANIPSKWKSLFQMSSIGLLLVLVSLTEAERTTEWGRNALGSLVSSPLFGQAFGLTFWLMVLAAAVGIVGTIQYGTQYASVFMKKKKIPVA